MELYQCLFVVIYIQTWCRVEGELDCLPMFECETTSFMCDTNSGDILTSAMTWDLPGCLKMSCHCCRPVFVVTADTRGQTTPPSSSTVDFGQTLPDCKLSSGVLQLNGQSAWAFNFAASAGVCEFLYVLYPTELIENDNSLDDTDYDYYRRQYCCTEFVQLVDMELSGTPPATETFASVTTADCKIACISAGPRTGGALCWGFIMRTSVSCDLLYVVSNTWFDTNLFSDTGKDVYVLQYMCAVDFVSTTPGTTTSTNPTTTMTTTTTPTTTTTTTATTSTPTTTTATTSTSTTTTARPSTPTTTTPSTTVTTPTTIPTTTTTGTSSTTPGGTTQPELCQCSCDLQNSLQQATQFENLTPEEKEEAIQQKIEEVQKELTVDTEVLSSTVRKKSSASDERVTAKVVGFALGTTMLSVVFGLIILADLPLLVQHIRLFGENAKLWLSS